MPSFQEQCLEDNSIERCTVIWGDLERVRWIRTFSCYLQFLPLFGVEYSRITHQFFCTPRGNNQLDTIVKFRRLFNGDYNISWYVNPHGAVLHVSIRRKQTVVIFICDLVPILKLVYIIFHMLQRTIVNFITILREVDFSEMIKQMFHLHWCQFEHDTKIPKTAWRRAVWTLFFRFSGKGNDRRERKKNDIEGCRGVYYSNCYTVQ